MVVLRIRNFSSKNIWLSIIGGLRVLISGSLYLQGGVRAPFKECLSLVVSETIEENKIHRVTQMEVEISLVLPTKVIDLQPSELLNFNIWSSCCHWSPSLPQGRHWSESTTYGWGGGGGCLFVAFLGFHTCSPQTYVMWPRFVDLFSGLIDSVDIWVAGCIW